MSKIGKEVYGSGTFLIKPASANSPAYKSGFVIGERRLKPSSPSTKAKNSKSEKNASKRKHEDDGGAS